MKKLYTLTILLLSKLVMAADATGINGLDTTITQGQEVLRVAARWGGVGLLVFVGLMFGFTKAKGEGLTFLLWLVLGLGLIISAFGWWTTVFTDGFAF